MPYAYVESSMDDFTDEEVREEYAARGLGDRMSDERELLTKAWIADREGRKDEAYALLRGYMLDKLNKVV